MSDEEEEEQSGTKKIVLPEYMTRTNELRQDLFEKILVLAGEGVAKHKLQKDIAQHVKQALDTDQECNELVGKGPWQVIVGRSFASAVTHEAMHICFFDLPKYQETFLIYKSLGVQSV
mmetsp:Transcript_80839/g.142588  ORF Transcript_80839/g.142588 Transcript_80839/m.142588 type:complete len:118 (+) Transcript_80839:65-418(+)|eukprot:CAMPEP_0197647366 /NCGR_PEP_ID=MMETSP1338-20131121/25070_1 /TAXON_ID=43686 ORGANISM="Pelagodinium beii, Strain RCC1491" /NCGR_SAMPLE_ID=MMETSP1338 /ASSEMBLY_ACC=CAM_ASM_000754 /LENGTH=117 /DNA_ID=CAMNT_0043221145 /DNA_START=65 /DNA_END=418 /DNA_ORIENTATION=-